MGKFCIECGTRMENPNFVVCKDCYKGARKRKSNKEKDFKHTNNQEEGVPIDEIPWAVWGAIIGAVLAFMIKWGALAVITLGVLGAVLGFFLEKEKEKNEEKGI